MARYVAWAFSSWKTRKMRRHSWIPVVVGRGTRTNAGEIDRHLSDDVPPLEVVQEGRRESLFAVHCAQQVAGDRTGAVAVTRMRDRHVQSVTEIISDEGRVHTYRKGFLGNPAGPKTLHGLGANGRALGHLERGPQGIRGLLSAIHLVEVLDHDVARRRQIRTVENTGEERREGPCGKPACRVHVSDGGSSGTELEGIVGGETDRGDTHHPSTALAVVDTTTPGPAALSHRGQAGSVRDSIPAHTGALDKLYGTEG